MQSVVAEQVCTVLVRGTILLYVVISSKSYRCKNVVQTISPEYKVKLEAAQELGGHPILCVYGSRTF